MNMSHLFKYCCKVPSLFRYSSTNALKHRISSYQAVGSTNRFAVLSRNLHSSSLNLTTYSSDGGSLSFEEKLKLQKEQIFLDEKDVASSSTNTRLSKVWAGDEDLDGAAATLSSNNNNDHSVYSSHRNENVQQDNELLFKKGNNFSNYSSSDDDGYKSSTTTRRRKSFDDEEDTDFYGLTNNRKYNEHGSKFRKVNFDDDDNNEWGNQLRRGPRQDKFSDNAEEADYSSKNEIELPPLQKNFFQPTSSLLERAETENAEYLKLHKISIKGDKIYPSIQQFSDHVFPERVINSLAEYDAPTAIQAMGWSVAFSGKDLIGIGQTGSGKTLGYILPGLMHVSHQRDVLEKEGLNSQDSPLGLVLAPTRELVQQIMQVYMQYCPSYRMRGLAMFGGASRSRQLDALRYNPKFVVATPGRLIDFIRAGEVKLDKCSYIVLDEADRMLDMGFEPQIRSIMQHIRKDRQTLMWSATWPNEVKELASQFLTDPVQITVGSDKLAANPDVKQHVYVCDSNEKLNMLDDLISTMVKTNSANQAIVFCETKRSVDYVTRALLKQDIEAEAIHGDKSQSLRDRALNGFRKGKFNVLVATEVAARGIDIPVLKCVVNFDFPNDVESYVHRIGRTGRCGNKGLAYTFFTREDAPKASQLVDIMEEAGQKIPSDLQNLCHVHSSGIMDNKRKKHNSYGSYRKGGGGSQYGRGGGSRW